LVFLGLKIRLKTAQVYRKQRVAVTRKQAAPVSNQAAGRKMDKETPKPGSTERAVLQGVQKQVIQ
jgi:hypothetical protein